ncbi:hypothetical protein ACROYT_G003545 [Oculina patagonica]
MLETIEVLFNDDCGICLCTCTCPVAVCLECCLQLVLRTYSSKVVAPPHLRHFFPLAGHNMPFSEYPIHTLYRLTYSCWVTCADSRRAAARAIPSPPGDLCHPIAIL